MRYLLVVCLLASSSACAPSSLDLVANPPPDGDTDSPVDTDATAPRCLLHTGGSDTPVLVWMNGNRIHVARSTGYTSEVATITEPAGADFGQSWLVSRYGYVSAGKAWYVSGEWRQWSAVLLAADGTVLWSRDGTGLPNEVVLTTDGTVTLGIEQSGSALSIRADGTQYTFVGMTPVGEAGTSGKIPARGADGYAWLDPNDETVTPFAYVVDGLLPTTRGVVYRSIVADVPSLVFEDGASVTVVETPVAGFSRLGGLDQSGEALAGDGALVGTAASRPPMDRSWDDLTMWQADFGDATLRQVTPPTGLWRLETRRIFGPIIDESGGVYDVWRDGTQAGLRVTHDGGATWTLVGRAYTDIAFLDVYYRSGTFVLESASAPPFNDPRAPWESSSEALLTGDTVQVVRPENNVSWVIDTTLESSYVVVSEDGVCAANRQWSALTSDWSLVLRNLDDGRELRVEGSSENRPEMWRWIEGARQ